MKYTGTVVEGAKMAGKIFGFPTANIVLKHSDLEPGSVHAGKVTVGNKTYDAVIYYGIDNHVLEAHLFKFNGKLVGQEITVEPLKTMSEFAPFVSVEQMKAKIRKDVQMAKEFLCLPE